VKFVCKINTAFGELYRKQTGTRQDYIHIRSIVEFLFAQEFFSKFQREMYVGREENKKLIDNRLRSASCNSSYGQYDTMRLRYKLTKTLKSLIRYDIV